LESVIEITGNLIRV